MRVFLCYDFRGRGHGIASHVVANADASVMLATKVHNLVDLLQGRGLTLRPRGRPQRNLLPSRVPLFLGVLVLDPSLALVLGPDSLLYLDFLPLRIVCGPTAVVLKGWGSLGINTCCTVSSKIHGDLLQKVLARSQSHRIDSIRRRRLDLAAVTLSVTFLRGRFTQLLNLLDPVRRPVRLPVCGRSPKRRRLRI